MRASVVLDTNVVLSALLRPGGLEDHVFKLALARKLQLCISPAVLAEYAEVLARPKFKLPAADVHVTVANIREAAIMVRPAEILAISRDEFDNRFLECAEAAEADYLVTGNTRHFPVAHKKTKVMGAACCWMFLTLRQVGDQNRRYRATPGAGGQILRDQKIPRIDLRLLKDVSRPRGSRLPRPTETGPTGVE